MLTQACRTRDVLDQLDEEVRERGLLRFDGAPRPAVIEQRLQSITLARLIGSLRLPDDNDVRPQRRVTSRGTYQTTRRAWREGRLVAVP